MEKIISKNEENNFLKGVILKGVGGFYTVKSSNKLYECKAKGSFRKQKIIPIVGDRVEFSIVNENEYKGFIEKIIKRKTELTRPMVANIDQVAIVVAAKSPNPDLNLMDKLLITAQSKGISPFIIINKVDLCDENDVIELKNQFIETGYNIFLLDSKKEIGYEGFHKQLTGKITAFAGQSGVGKSTILNNIMNDWVMETGKVSDKIQRGKHTTRHAQLVELDSGGYVVDTPGFSSFELTQIRYDELENFYPEFFNHIGKCKYNGCSHISEPNCSIKMALEDNLISKERYNRYVDLYKELKIEYDNRYK